MEKKEYEQRIKELVSEVISNTKRTGCEYFLRTLIFSKSNIQFNDDILSLIKNQFPDKEKDIMNLICEDRYGCGIDSVHMSSIRTGLVEREYNKL